MSKKRVTLFLIAALSLALVLPAMAVGDQAEVSWTDTIVELVEEVVDFFAPETPEDESGEASDELPSVIPVIDPNG